MDSTNTPNGKFVQYLARPLSDYFLSKAEKNKQKKPKIDKDEKSLYQDALERFSRHKLAVTTVKKIQADESALKACNSFKPCNKSEKLSEFKKNREFDLALKDCESPIGFISSQGLHKLLQDLDLLLPVFFTVADLFV